MAVSDTWNGKMIQIGGGGFNGIFIRKTLSKDNGTAWLSSEDRLTVQQVSSDLYDGDVIYWRCAIEKKEEIFEKLSFMLTPAQIEGLHALSEDMELPYAVTNGVKKVSGYLSYMGIGLDTLYASDPSKRDEEMMKMGAGTVQYIIMKDSTYNIDQFDMEKCKHKILEASKLLDATNPDISDFKARFGKREKGGNPCCPQRAQK